MTYEEMKEKIYRLQLEDLAHGIKVKELPFERGFEIAGLGITYREDYPLDRSPDHIVEGYCVIYKGSIFKKSRSGSYKPQIIEQLPCDKAYDKYFEMLKDMERKTIRATTQIKITPEMTIARGTTTQSGLCNTEYIIYKEENFIVITGTQKGWNEKDGVVHIYPAYTRRLAKSLEEFIDIPVSKIESQAYGAWMDGAM